MHRHFLALFILLILLPFARAAENAPESPAAAMERAPKPESSSLHFQTTEVTQSHGTFTSPYMGANSLSPSWDSQTSVTMTFFASRSLWRGADLSIDPELAGGSGFNQTRGLAAFPNGEIYRVDDASPKWNFARIYLRQVFGLGGATETVKPDKNALAGTVDVNRVTVVIGRFALNDYFDNNTYSHDPRTQFLNWALMDAGSWDYAADTRGYTVGAYIEYNQARWTARFASVLEPLAANQMEFDTDYPNSRSDNLEFEYRWTERRPGAIRLMTFQNHARMGNYRTALESGTTPPDVTATRSATVKTGIGLNFEQELTDGLGFFSRLAWSDGRVETWAFTEIERALSLGLSWKGDAWRRPSDQAGIAYVLSALGPEHRDYLAAGGLGFIVGDGRLNYAPEQVIETYYSWRVMDGLDVSGDYQLFANPAYNADRGPVSVLAFRTHYEM